MKVLLSRCPDCNEPLWSVVPVDEMRYASLEVKYCANCKKFIDNPVLTEMIVDEGNLQYIR